MGARVLVLTGSLDMVAQMSCNPAIGGVAKGHLVKELDALGGEMASVIDVTGIQYRRLNASKGPAVRSTRAQADKRDRKSTRLNSSHSQISYAVFCLKKKTNGIVPALLRNMSDEPKP